MDILSLRKCHIHWRFVLKALNEWYCLLRPKLRQFLWYIRPHGCTSRCSRLSVLAARLKQTCLVFGSIKLAFGSLLNVVMVSWANFECRLVLNNEGRQSWMRTNWPLLVIQSRRHGPRTGNKLNELMICKIYFIILLQQRGKIWNLNQM